MEERTMNEIPMKEIWEKLRAPFTQMGNRDFLVDPPQICRFGESGRESCIVSGCGYCRDVGDYVGNPVV